MIVNNFNRPGKWLSVTVQIHTALSPSISPTVMRSLWAARLTCRQLLLDVGILVSRAAVLHLTLIEVSADRM
jgi:hypothetical protein